MVDNNRTILCSVLIILAVTLSIFTCSSDKNNTRVILNIGSNPVSASMDLPLFDRLLRFFSTEARAQVPSNISSITVTVTADDMEPIQKNYTPDVTTVILDVPAGLQRIFSVRGDAKDGNVIYIGRSQPADLIAGETINISIVMNPFSWDKIYVANYNDDTVSVIDGQTNTVVNTIPVGDGPGGVGVNRYTKLVYVSNDIIGTVSVIDWASDTVINTITATANSSPNPLFIVDVNPNTNKVYITQCFESDLVTVIDGADDRVTAITTPGSYTFGIGINTWNNKIYVSIWNPTVVINGLTDEITGYVTGGLESEARDVEVNPVTNKIYVAENSNGIVEVIDGITDTVSTSITVGIQPYGVGVNSDTNKIYVANFDDGTVSVIDGSKDSVINTITVESGPMGVAVNPITNRIYVANSGSGTVSVINGATDTVITTVTVGASPAYLDVLMPIIIF